MEREKVAKIGDWVRCNSMIFEIAQIYSQDFWEDEGWDIEFKDSVGTHRRWKQWLDEGEFIPSELIEVYTLMREMQRLDRNGSWNDVVEEIQKDECSIEEIKEATMNALTRWLEESDDESYSKLYKNLINRTILL